MYVRRLYFVDCLHPNEIRLHDDLNCWQCRRLETKIIHENVPKLLRDTHNTPQLLATKIYYAQQQFHIDIDWIDTKAQQINEILIYNFGIFFLSIYHTQI